MNKNIIEQYQCCGCIHGCDTSCYEKDAADDVSCKRHSAGTIVTGIGLIFLGMPTGFNRLGYQNDLKICIYENINNGFGGKLNVFVWKYLDSCGNTLVRGFSPRINSPFLHIYIGDHISNIDCIEITDDDLNEMD
jgi:hypothetical protein